MSPENLREVVQALTPEEQASVLQFIEYLKGRAASKAVRSPYLQAADEFIAEHPELLRRIAQ
ncbi:MAG: hypothetical protein ACLQGV_12290 [Bryobacteraceae bacterium]